MATKSQTNTRKRTRASKTSNRQRSSNPNILERGDIFFFYRPADDNTPPDGLLDVNRFHLVLRPQDREILRYITIGKKKLPGDHDNPRNWGFVDGVFSEAEDLRQALMETGRATARPAGEGVYALVRQGRNTVLAYALELPEEPGEVQRTFHIERQGHFTLVIKNPEAPSPSGIGLDEDRKAEFPEDLMARFGDRKWIGADPPEFLDHEGAELILIAGDDNGVDLGIDLEPQPEDEQTSEVFGKLHLERSERAVHPLFEGTWE